MGKMASILAGIKKSTDPLDVATLSFPWILPFWYFCFLYAYKASLTLYACAIKKAEVSKRYPYLWKAKGSDVPDFLASKNTAQPVIDHARTKF